MSEDLRDTRQQDLWEIWNHQGVARLREKHAFPKANSPQFTGDISTLAVASPRDGVSVPLFFSDDAVKELVRLFPAPNGDAVGNSH